MIIVIILLLAGAGVAAYFWQHKTLQNQMSLDEQENRATSSRIDKLRSEVDSSQDKKATLMELGDLLGGEGRDEEAVQAYEQVLALPGVNLSDGEYVMIAYAYSRVNNVTKANEMLDLAKAKADQIENEDDRNDAIADIDTARTEVTEQ